MFTELIKSANGRLKSYLGLTFFISWVIHNRGVVLALFSMDSLPFDERMRLLEGQLPCCFCGWIGHMFFAPLGVALVASILFILVQSLIKAGTEYGDNDLRGRIYSRLPWAHPASPLVAKEQAKRNRELSNQVDKLEDELISTQKTLKITEQNKDSLENKNVSSDKELKQLNEKLKAEESKSTSLTSQLSASENLKFQNLISGNFKLFRESEVWKSENPENNYTLRLSEQENAKSLNESPLKIKDNKVIINAKNTFWVAALEYGFKQKEVYAFVREANETSQIFRLVLKNNEKDDRIWEGYLEVVNWSTDSKTEKYQEWLLIKES
jgi:hypothetical protein